MKKTILIVALLVSGFVYQSASAQLRVSIRANIGVQPAWGPTGYDYVEYYYLPDIDAFYYVPKQQYIYMDRGRWQFSTSLPSRFRSYNFNTGYKVVVNEPKPYYHIENYRTQYGSYKGNHSQQTIRNSQDSKYFESKYHPQHNKWKGNKGRGQGQGRRN
ncbi:MAG: hypothetical protein ABUL41_02405 [Chitinophagaceae bacterium]